MDLSIDERLPSVESGSFDMSFLKNNVHIMIYKGGWDTRYGERKIRRFWRTVSLLVNNLQKRNRKNINKIYMYKQ